MDVNPEFLFEYHESRIRCTDYLRPFDFRNEFMDGLRSLAQEDGYLYDAVVAFSALIQSIRYHSQNVRSYARTLHMQVKVKFRAQQRGSPDNKALLATILQLATFEVTLLIHEVLTDNSSIANHSCDLSSW
jgi:hypothetical protein